MDGVMRMPTSRWITLGLITAAALYLSYLIFLPFVLVILWAIVLTIVARRPFERFRKWGLNDNFASIGATLTIALCVLVPLTAIGIGVVEQVRDVADQFRARADELRSRTDEAREGPATQSSSRLMRFVGQVPGAQKVLNSPYVSGEFVKTQLQQIGQRLANSAVGLAGSALSTIVQIVLVLFTMFYLLRDRREILNLTAGVLPLDRPQFDRLTTRIHDIISASLYGTLVVAAVQGAMGGLAFWVLGIGGSLFWGVVMFFLSMIPVAGAFVIWVPVALYLAFTGHVTKAILLTAWGGGAIATVDNLLRPILVGSRTKMHELVVFFSVLGGLQVFGMLGLIVGPVVVAVAAGLLEMFRGMDFSADAGAEPGIGRVVLAEPSPRSSDMLGTITVVPVQQQFTDEQLEGDRPST
jgi:predicted PurR-regulated permease PerM